MGAKNVENCILVIVKWPVGGINTYLRYVYTDSRFSDFKLDFLMPDSPDLTVLKEELRKENINIIPITGGEKRFWKIIWQKIFSKKYSVVHSHGFTSGILAAIPAKIVGVKHIITPHDIFSKNRFLGVKGKIKKYLICRILSLADIIQPVSYGAEKNLLEYMPALKKRANKKVFTIVNGIDVSRFQVSGVRDLHAELHLDPDVFLIGFMGRFMSQKGFKYLVQAVKKLLEDSSLNRNIKITAIGSGAFVREEMAAIDAQGMSDIVYFLPSTNEVAKTLRGLDLLVMPSLWEACSLLAMEALVAGVPVIGTDCVGLGEVLEGSPARIVHTRDVIGLAEVIREHVLDNRRSKFEEYSKIAVQRYNISRVVESVVELYQKMISSYA